MAWIYDIFTARTHSTAVLVLIAELLGFKIFCSNVQQAYLQGKETITQNVFIKTAKESFQNPTSCCNYYGRFMNLLTFMTNEVTH